MSTFTQGDEELGAIRVGSPVGHTEEGLGIEGSCEVFVREGATIDRFATRAVEFREIYGGTEVLVVF